MSKWISVDDGLPEDNGEVMVYCFDEEVKMYYCDIDFVNGMDEYFYSNGLYVTHWQPFPEPPTDD